jgi:hypothetical protein
MSDHLHLASEDVSSAQRHLVLAIHHAEAGGIGVEAGDLLAELDQLRVDLLLFAFGEFAVTDLRPAVPDYVVEAAVAYRTARDRQPLGRPA